MSMRSEIIARLEKEILPLQSFRPHVAETSPVLPELVNAAFPLHRFPIGVIHEFVVADDSQAAATLGFMSAVLSSLVAGGMIAWVGTSRNVFPAALSCFGIQPDHILFIHPQKAADLQWTLEEVLKCPALTAVIAEMPVLDFMASRRLQLAAERSRVTGLILRRNPRRITTTASMARWKISPLTSHPIDDLPGPGFPTWKVELTKIRNGKPGSWIMAWVNGAFELITPAAPVIHSHRKRA